MRRAWMLLLGAIAVGYYAVATVVSTLTLEDLARRPVTGFVRESAHPALGTPMIERLDLRVEDDFFGNQAEGTARPLGGVGTLLGYRRRFLTPGGGEISCLHILRWMACDSGWEAQRAP